MEKKTIGGFISALRKANGMTQKDLAERLNVSDKTVSRWECEEGAPDLSLIPVIAEIFGVSCDELLRGERKPPAERTEDTPEPWASARGRKQRQRILKSAMAEYKTRTYIAMGISVVGLMAALICNLAFLKAVLGFLVGAVFFAAGIVCQIVFLNRALFSVDDDEFADSPNLNGFKRTAVRLTELSVGLTVCLIGFTFPLVLLDAYVGLGSDSMLLFGFIGTAVFLVLYGVVLWFVNAQLICKGVYLLDKREEEIYRYNHKLQKNCAVILVALLAVTFIVHQLMTSIYDPYSIMKGITFEDYDSFVTFMEQDIPYEEWYFNGTSAIETIVTTAPDDTAAYYDQFGNEITEEEALRRTVEDNDGNVLCEYIDRNGTVCSVRYGSGEDKLPITVSTYDDLEDARQAVGVRNVIFAAVYVAEAAGMLMVYFLKRAK